MELLSFSFRMLGYEARFFVFVFHNASMLNLREICIL